MNKYLKSSQNRILIDTLLAVFFYLVRKNLSIAFPYMQNALKRMIAIKAEVIENVSDFIEAIKSRNLVLQVGHIERFDPAIIAAAPFINSSKFIEVNRLGPYDSRTSHIGVVLDLMIHGSRYIVSSC